MFNCSRCNIEFSTRKELGRHVYEVHNPKAPRPKSFVVPTEMVEDIQYLSKGTYVKVEGRGIINDKGIDIENFKLV